MPYSNILTASLAAFATVLSCADVAGQRSNRSSWRDRSELKHIVSKPDVRLDSEAVRNATYSVYLPKDYDAKENAQTRYPVVYFLHGMFEDHNRFGMRGGAKALDDAIDAKTLPAVIFVCAYDGSRRSFYVNSKADKVETMIVDELVPSIDKQYRTLARREQRVLMGVSMGGFGAMKIAFKHPKVFGILATHSAAILPEESKDLEKMFPWAQQSRLATTIFGDPVDQKLWSAENPLIIAKTMASEDLASLAIYFDCGDHDRYGLDATNTRMHDLLAKRKIPHTWQLVKDGNHGWNTRSSDVGYNNANLPNSLRFVGAALARKTADPKKDAPGRDAPQKK